MAEVQKIIRSNKIWPRGGVGYNPQVAGGVSGKKKFPVNVFSYKYLQIMKHLKSMRVTTNYIQIFSASLLLMSIR